VTGWGQNSRSWRGAVPIVVGLAAIKVINPGLYVKAKRGTLKWDDIRTWLGFYARPDEKADWMKHTFEFWEFCTTPGEIGREHQLYEYQQSIAGFNVERERIVAFVANAIIDRLTPA
jgi:hypothetical protein